MVNESVVHAVVGIIQKKDRILVAERPRGKPFSGYWEFPGGKIEDGEASITALQRELYEELGIKVVVANFLFQHQHEYPDRQVCLDIWQVSEYQGEPHSGENQELQWLSLPDILQLKLLEGNFAIVTKLQEILAICEQ